VPSPASSPRRDGTSSSTPATADGLSAFADSPTVTAIAGDVTDPLHRTALANAVADRPLDLLANNASRLGPSPQPQLATYDLDELRRVYDTNLVRAPRSRPAAAPRAARRRSGHDRQRHLGRLGRGLRGLGRLRQQQGRPRPSLRRTRRGAPRPAGLRVRPWRHAHRHAPGGLPRRGHLRPAGAGGRRPRAARPSRPASTQRPVRAVDVLAPAGAR